MKTLVVIAALLGIAGTAHADPRWRSFNADAASRTPYATSERPAAEEAMPPRHEDFGASSAQNVARTLGYR